VHLKQVIDTFAKQIFNYIPGFTGGFEAEEFLDRILVDIAELSMKKATLAAEKDLHLAIAKKSNDKHNTEGFCAAAMQWFPNLQKKYEVCKDTFTSTLSVFFIGLGQAVQDLLYQVQSRNCSLCSLKVNTITRVISADDINGVFNLILGGIAEMESAKDNALEMNAPLRDQIMEMKKKLAAEAKALKLSQESRDQDRAKHMQELTKKEGDVFNHLHQAKKAASDFDQYKKSQQKKVENSRQNGRQPSLR
jgi:hypothetical protein